MASRMAKTQLRQINDAELLALLRQDRALMDEVGEEYFFQPELDHYGQDVDQASLQAEVLNQLPSGVLPDDREINIPGYSQGVMQQLIAAALARGEG